VAAGGFVTASIGLLALFLTPTALWEVQEERMKGGVASSLMVGGHR
jgi:hypothetical protein